jgi:glycosyltransferase involved in cell wall biosynthesis
LKIGLLTTYLALGENNDSGIGQHYRILADALTERGHDVHVFFLCRKDMVVETKRELARLAPRWKCTVVTAQLPRWWVSLCGNSWPAFQLLSQLRLAKAGCTALLAVHQAESFAIVETHSYNLPAFFLLAARRRPPVLTRVSTSLGQIAAISLIQSRVLRFGALLERRVIRKSDALVTHTNQHRDTICAEEGYLPSRFSIVTHGLPDPGKPAPFAAENTDGQIEFLFVGRFEARKGIDVLLSAIPSVIAAYPQVHFTLAGDRGDGVAWEAFERNYPALAGSRVLSLGRVSAEMLTSLYRRCAVLVAPSRYESFGLIYAEAMSHGKPAIGCRSGGTPEVVTDGVTGLLAEPGNVASLETCLHRLAADADLRCSMGEAARADFLQRFSAQQLAEATVTLYQQVAKR